MNSQQLRIIIAGALTLLCAAGVILLAALSRAIPTLLEIITSGSLFYLFGVVTNGSGLGGGGAGTGAGTAAK